MAQGRKLQTEIEKTFKRILEGIEEFDDIMEKLQSSTAQNLKEKYEADLKREIKKLQRYRDQIKTWSASSEVKDKAPLIDHRKLIETKMEEFKATEKVMKTKAFSKEGLASNKMDPKAKAKYETSKWISGLLDELQVQVDKDEADLEATQATSRRGKGAAADKVDQLTKRLERHRYHQQRLEIIMRMIDNDALDPEEVNSIQDGVTYYIRENQDPDFVDDENLYDELNLPESFDSGDEADSGDESDDSSAPPKRSAAAESHKAEGHKGRAAAAAAAAAAPAPAPEPEPAPTPAPAPTPTVNEWSIKKRTPSSAGEEDKQKAAAAATTAAAAAGKKTAVPAAAAPAPAPAGDKSAPSSPVKKGAAPAAAAPAVASVAAVPASQPAAAKPPAARDSTPNFAPVVVAPAVAAKKDGPAVPLAAVVAAGSAKAAASAAAQPTQTFAGVVAPLAKSEAVVPKVASSTDAFPPVQLTGKAPVTQQQQQQQQQAPKSPEEAPTSKAPGPVQPASAQAAEGKEEERDFPFDVFEHGMPPLLADLAHAFNFVRSSGRADTVTPAHVAALDASFQSLQNRAEQPDSDRPRMYIPRNPVPTPQHYPQQPLPILENPNLFSLFDTDTLFFIFYAQPGTYAQYLAARELKNQSWRFHKKHNMWFQRHEEPKTITDEYEQGTYVYFDHETTWSPRKKSDFVFDYRFLEDEQL